MKNTVITIRVSENTKTRLQTLSDARVAHISDIVRDAIKNHIQMMDSTN